MLYILIDHKPTVINKRLLSTLKQNKQQLILNTKLNVIIVYPNKLKSTIRYVKSLPVAIHDSKQIHGLRRIKELIVSIIADSPTNTDTGNVEGYVDSLTSNTNPYTTQNTGDNFSPEKQNTEDEPSNTEESITQRMNNMMAMRNPPYKSNGIPPTSIDASTKGDDDFAQNIYSNAEPIII